MSIPRSYRQMPGTCIYVCECICVFTYHCLIVEGRRRCPRGPALSGPSGPVRSGPSGLSGPGSWAQGTGADWTDRTGPDRAGTARWPSLVWPCPVRSGPSGPLQCQLGPRRPDRTDRTGPDWTGPRITSSLFLFAKRWSVAPKQAFGPKVMERCSKTCFWTKSDGALLQNKLLEQK